MVAACCRELEKAPSKSTAGRILLDGREVVQHHFGELYSKATHVGGISFATDTTTIKRAERASNHFEMRFNGEERRVKAPVIELASHTASEQFEHNVCHIFEDTCMVMESAALVPENNWKRVSIAFLNRVMGDHVNEALWNLVEPAKFKELDDMLTSGDITPEEASKFKVFVRTKCSKHKLAKLSKDACNAMGKMQIRAAAKHANMEMKKRTYESLGYKVTEVTAWQFSNDISVGNPHGHAQAFADCEDCHDFHPRMAYPNVNKNRHYRHEKNARKVLLYCSRMMAYLTEVRDRRDDLQHPNKVTKLGNAVSRLWMALHPDQSNHHMNETHSQLVAMDMLDSLFFSPGLCMITSPATDVINIGAQWRAGYDWCAHSVPDKTDGELMEGGLEHRCFRAFRKKDKTKAQTKTAFDLEFDPPVINKLTSPEFQSSEFKLRCMEYFRIAVKAISTGILSIASEYFPATYDGHTVQVEDGELYEPSEDVKRELAGFLAS